MTIQQIQEGKSETLRKVSDKTLETEKAVITVGGAGGAVAPRVCVQVLNKGSGKCYGFVLKNGGLWTLLLNGVEVKQVKGKKLDHAKLTKSIMEQQSLGEFAPSWFGNLLSRAVWGLCYAQTIGQRLDGKYDIINEGMEHAGLSVSTDGQITKRKAVSGPVQHGKIDLEHTASPSRRPRGLHGQVSRISHTASPAREARSL